MVMMILSLGALLSTVPNECACSFSAFAKCQLKSAALKSYQQPGLWAKQDTPGKQTIFIWSCSKCSNNFNFNHLRFTFDCLSLSKSFLFWGVGWGINVSQKLNITKLFKTEKCQCLKYLNYVHEALITHWRLFRRPLNLWTGHCWIMQRPTCSACTKHRFLLWTGGRRAMRRLINTHRSCLYISSPFLLQTFKYRHQLELMCRQTHLCT